MVLIFNILATFLTILQFAIIARALLSWFDPTMRTPVSQVLVQVTEPIIAPIRRLVPSVGMIDISPMVAFLVIYVLRMMLSRAMVGY